MKATIHISQSTIDRIKVCKEDQSGALYGLLHKDKQYVLGLFSNDDYSYADLLFPSNIDMCGAYQMGAIDKEEVNKILMDVDVTDNPIFISIPEPNIVTAYHVINNKLEPAELTILSDSAIYADFIHIRLQAPILLTSEIDVESVNEELLVIRKQISSGKLAFQNEKYSMYILSENSIIGSLKFHDDMALGKLEKHFAQAEQEYSRISEISELEVLPFSMLKKGTCEKSDNPNAHAPVIQIEQKEMRMLSIVLKIDAISLVHRETTLNQLYTILVESACRNLKLIGNYIMDVMTDNDNSLPEKFQPELLHFFPNKCGHFVTRIMNKNSEDEMNVRILLHKNFLLPVNRPIFRRGNVYNFKTNQVANGQTRLLSPHKEMRPPTGGGEVALVDGDYLYYHYKQDGMDDDGWGCAYRSLQTLASWLLLQGHTDKPVPSFKQIQECLYDIGDKPAAFVGSKQWIGSTEVNFVLESLLGTSCRILNVSSGEELAGTGADLIHHFRTSGAPIMIGGGVLAHTILGVDCNRDTGDVKFLILDPHYTGADHIKTILTKGWCTWKSMSFWDKKAYYNMCLPIVQPGV